MKKISFKKIATVVSNNYRINRSIPSILALIVIILGGIVGGMPVSDIETRYGEMVRMGFMTKEDYHLRIKEIFDMLLGGDGAFSILFMISVFALAFFSVLSLTSFMRDKSSVDFYHSMSVSRGEIYLAHFITAFLNSAIAVILSQTVGLLAMSLIAKDPAYTFGEMLLLQLPVLFTALLYLALFIAIALLSAVISGTVFSTVISFLFINFAIPATVLAVALSGSQLFNTDFLDYLSHRPQIYPYSSPFIRYSFGISEEALPHTARTFILMFLSVVAFILLGLFLYSRKKNENSLHPFAFPAFKFPFKAIVLFDAILLGTTFFEAITNSFLWALIGGFIALFFGFIFINAFFNKSFAGVLKKSREMVYILVITLVLGAVFVADVFGIYHIPEPDAEDITRADVHLRIYEKTSHKNYDFYFYEDDEYLDEYGEILDDEAKNVILDFYKAVEEEKKVPSAEYKEKIPDTNERHEISASVGFSCKNDFSDYHAYLWAVEGEENYEILEDFVDTLIENYSHSLYAYDDETGWSESVEVKR